MLALVFLVMDMSYLWDLCLRWFLLLSIFHTPGLARVPPVTGMNYYLRSRIGEIHQQARSKDISIKKALITQSFFLFGGRDGTRTRDPVRDRHVF